MRPAPHHARLIALAALLVAGCARDLELPGVPTTPTLTGFAPGSAHAGQLLRITAAHLAPDATANTVHFATASARGERWDGDDLVVRVPADAGDGPIAVSNRDGTSEPSGAAFDYLGLGEPRRLQAATASPILHRPEAVHAVGGDLILHSTLYRGLVWAGSSAFATPDATQTTAAPWQGANGALYFAAYDASTADFRLSRVDGATGAVTHEVALPVGLEPAQLLATRGDDVLVVFAADGLVLDVYDLADLTHRFGPSAHGMESFDGAADVGDGRVVMAGFEPSAFDFTLAILDVRAGLSGPMPAPIVLAPPAGPAMMDYGFDGRVAVAVGRASGAIAPGPLVGPGDRLAAVSLDDGDVAVANLDLATPAFVLTVETWSPSAIASIAAAPTDGTLGAQVSVGLATKPGDGLAIGFDLATGRLLWSVPGSAPTAASANGPLAFVAHAGDNDVSVVNLQTGARVARVNLDVHPDAAHFFGAAAFVPTGAGVDGDLLFASRDYPALLRFDTGTGEPALVARGTVVDFVDADPASATAWASSADPATVRPWAGTDWTASPPVPLTGGTAPQRTASRGTRLAVAHDGGLSLVDGAALVGTASLPGAPDPSFLALGFTPGGDVWTLVDRWSGFDFIDTQLQRWTPAAIAAGGSPSAAWTVPGSDTGEATAWTAALLDGELWVFWQDDLAASWGTLLDDALATVRTVPASAELTAIDAVSPNGRLLVQRVQDTSIGFLVRFFRADPEAGFPAIQTLVFEDAVEGFAFDAAGERLFVLTRAADRIVTVD